ncbi:recombinase [Flavobacterium silvaticum]|uniref:Site-specific recombinase n=1 Tax=Flavobacterium silvaticum TaxID=1852020 RepID=A0A972JH71_9FLAO|nr:recombinase [Flavobacterium silvaticum]NMH27630.1 site-specific recombinase [Flavobacterium silvaticum]
MILGKKKRAGTTQIFWTDQLAACLEKSADTDDPQLLVDIIQAIRPKNASARDKFDLLPVLEFFRDNPETTQKLSRYLTLLFKGKKFSRFLSDAAILQGSDFFYEIKKRISHKILPYQPAKDQLEYILNQVFFLATDRFWVERIPMWQLEELYDLFGFSSIYDTVQPETSLSQMLLAMDLIIQRISGRAMETEVLQMVPEFDGMESPFIGFERELLQIEERLRMSDIHYMRTSDLIYRQLVVMHHQSMEFVDKAFANSGKYGISIRVNQSLLKIRQQLERLGVLMPLLAADEHSQKRTNSIKLALELIKYNCHKNNIRKFLSESTQLISYEITQHTAKTGEHYITGTGKEYFRMLRSAMGGGFIVGFLCLFKLLLSKVDTSIFGHAFLYSMNYSLGFILIYLTGATLATKQPAMTASVLARSIDDESQKGKPAERYTKFAVLFARVFRSQFIAFVGNVIMAFPVSLACIYLIDCYAHHNIADSKWLKLMADLSPIHSPLVFHAAIAGVFLFLSGIISGSIANSDKHNQVYYRIQEHPLLKKSIGKTRTQKLAAWYEKRWAGVVSNFWFGIFMGSVAPIGIFLGLDLDIRHITFASGNMALGLYGSHFQVSTYLLSWAIVGIPLIGLVNFLVSFGLSASLALRSRNISLFELSLVSVAIFRHFKSKPASFFFPTEKQSEKIVAESAS